jgi:hypothetical protein
VWNFRNRASGQCADPVIHLLEKEAVQITKVAGDMERHDLARALGE